MATLECPICQRTITYASKEEVPFRPFCSRRCKLRDLGRWLNEEYRVSEEASPDSPNAGSTPSQDPREID
jgi:uncharacterized protein